MPPKCEYIEGFCKPRPHNNCQCVSSEECQKYCTDHCAPDEHTRAPCFDPNNNGIDAPCHQEGVCGQNPRGSMCGMGCRSVPSSKTPILDAINSALSSVGLAAVNAAIAEDAPDKVDVNETICASKYCAPVTYDVQVPLIGVHLCTATADYNATIGRVAGLNGARVDDLSISSLTLTNPFKEISGSVSLAATGHAEGLTVNGNVLVDAYCGVAGTGEIGGTVVGQANATVSATASGTVKPCTLAPELGTCVSSSGLGNAEMCGTCVEQGNYPKPNILNSNACGYEWKEGFPPPGLCATDCRWEPAMGVQITLDSDELHADSLDVTGLSVKTDMVFPFNYFDSLIADKALSIIRENDVAVLDAVNSAAAPALKGVVQNAVNGLGCIALD